MRTAPILIRFAFAALLAALLGVRLLAPAGFMPAFSHGAVTIISCPDADVVTMPMHHHGDHNKLHQPCPYASATALGTLSAGWDARPPALFYDVALSLGRTFMFVARNSIAERPPAIGPPLGV